MDETQQLLKELTEASGILGYEGDVRAIMERILADVAEVSHDKLGSVIGRRVGMAEQPRVMLVGHMDEIGFMVSYITPEGMIRFICVGWWWDQVLLGHRVTIKTRKGDVLGVFGAKPPHLLEQDELNKLVERKEMYIDVGACSEEEVRAMGVRIGDPIIPVGRFTVMANPNVYLAKAFDDRVGCALAVQALRQLAADGHPNTVYAAATVQEERGQRGAKTSSVIIDPDVGIVLETDIPGDVPGISPVESATKMGGGPTCLVHDREMIPNLKLRDLVIATAEAEGIPLQISPWVHGATDGSQIHVHGAGVPTVVLGVPTRHVHIPNSILCREDYDQTLRLVVALVKKLDAKTVAGLTA